MPKADALIEMIGDPRTVDRELKSFRRTARVLSSDHPRLIDEYPRQWIAAYRGKVRASGRSLPALLKQVDGLKLPREGLIVRYIDKNERTMIL